MVTVMNQQTQYAGLSTDTKPVDGVQNGDSFVEIDTSDIYYFDAENEEWVSPNGGGGGDGYKYQLIGENGQPEEFTADSGTHIFESPVMNSVLQEDEIKVAFDGTEYILPMIEVPGDYPYYGNIDENGFDIDGYAEGEVEGTFLVRINVSEHGTHTLSIYTKNEPPIVNDGVQELNTEDDEVTVKPAT